MAVSPDPKSALRRAEEALRESEERYRELVEGINDVIYELDTNGRITYISPVAEEVSGYSPTEIIGRSIVDFMPPEEVPARMESFGEGLAGRPIPTEFRLVSKSGEIRWIHTLGRVIREGDRITGFRGVLTDITQRKRAEEALRESEERYRALVEASPDAISLTDLEGRTIFCNKQALALLGFESMQEALGKNAFDFIAPEDRQRAADNAQRTLRMNSVSQIEYTLVRIDGSRVPVELGASVVVDAEGEPMGFIGVVRDITKRKETEESLKMARDELENKVERIANPDTTYGLTFRELTVLHLVAEGKSDGEIAAVLGISPRTANKHMENILAKMGASSRTEVGVRAVREQLLA